MVIHGHLVVGVLFLAGEREVGHLHRGGELVARLGNGRIDRERDQLGRQNGLFATRTENQQG